MITKGELFFDGSIQKFKEQFAGVNIVEISFESDTPDLSVLEQMPVKTTLSKNKLTIQYKEAEIKLPAIIEALSANNKLDGIQTKEADIEDIVRQLFMDMK
jgi:ABC-type uncharacterized transport system ATPase subunit